MNILISDLPASINKCEKCRKLAKNIGKETFLKNNQPNSGILPKALDKLSVFSKTDIVDFVQRLPSAGQRKVYTLDQLKHDLYLCNDL